jgi:hypothetical protein
MPGEFIDEDRTWFLFAATTCATTSAGSIRTGICIWSKEAVKDLLARTVYVSPQQLDAGAMPAGTVVVSKTADPVVNGCMKSGSLHKVAAISEPHGTPSFLITER